MKLYIQSASYKKSIPAIMNMLKKAGITDEETMKAIMERFRKYDPTENGKFTQWLIKSYINKSYDKVPGMRINKILTKYVDLCEKGKIKSPQNNLESFKSWMDFIKYFKDIYEKEILKDEYNNKRKETESFYAQNFMGVPVENVIRIIKEHEGKTISEKEALRRLIQEAIATDPTGAKGKYKTYIANLYNGRNSFHSQQEVELYGPRISECITKFDYLIKNGLIDEDTDINDFSPRRLVEFIDSKKDLFKNTKREVSNTGMKLLDTDGSIKLYEFTEFDALNNYFWNLDIEKGIKVPWCNKNKSHWDSHLFEHGVNSYLYFEKNGKPYLMACNDNVYFVYGADMNGDAKAQEPSEQTLIDCAYLLIKHGIKFCERFTKEIAMKNPKAKAEFFDTVADEPSAEETNNLEIKTAKQQYCINRLVRIAGMYYTDKEDSPKIKKFHKISKEQYEDSEKAYELLRDKIIMRSDISSAEKYNSNARQMFASRRYILGRFYKIN